ncbi:hypothetical protein JIN85_11060 [Luteolibacter pohnpeiensis]|uniref:DUF3153 domain-containing protein n=1 Tax=Luteolibacter pohnpeiensis TaxID=454153 RepID=A0A934SB59_9BACT|nr:hypothetical protein [Luteolibacter pohnpeiensis]MBK1882957.1 hypothetical protein [Luteolibacter pohnpeiensis]
MIRRIILLLCSLAICLSISSCIDGKEEIWLNADGSGKAEFHYQIPATAASFKGGADGIDAMLADLLKNQPEATHSAVSENGRVSIAVSLPFKSADDLKSLATLKDSGSMPDSFKYFAGKIDFAQSGRTISVSRTVDPGKALPGSGFYPKSQLKNHQLSYIVHLPLAATESNATRTEDAGKTLIWEVPLAKALRAPITTRFKAIIPIPGWLIGIAIGAGVAALAIVFLIVRALKKRRKG